MNRAIEFDPGSDYLGWYPLTSDVLGDTPVTWEYGIRSNGVMDRTGTTGMFSFALDNGPTNGAKKRRLYSPGDSDCLSGFEVGKRVRLKFWGDRVTTRDGAYSGTSTNTSDGIGDGGRSMSFGGASDGHVNLFSANLASDAPSSEGTIALWIKTADTTISTDATNRAIFCYEASTNNFISIEKLASQPTVNYCKNPSFEVNVTDDWTLVGAGATVARDNTYAKYGTYSAKLRAANAGNSYIGTVAGVSVANGASVTVSGWVRCAVAGKVGFNLYDPGWAHPASVYGGGTGDWQYITCTALNDSGGALTYNVLAINLYGDAASYVWFDACQLELQTATTPYCDGSLGDGHTWAGTAHNSTSSRSDGLVMFTHKAGGTARTRFDMAGEVTSFTHLAVTWDTNTVTYYRGGLALASSDAPGVWSGPLVGFTVGSMDTNSNEPWKGNASHVELWNTPLTASEVYRLSQNPEFQFDQAIKTQADNRIAYWPILETSGAAVEEWRSTEIYYKFIGRIGTIAVDAAQYGEQATRVDAVDWMDDAAKFKVSTIPTQLSKGTDEIMAQVIGYSGTAPNCLDLNSAADELTYSLQDTKGRATLLGELKKLAQSELGYIYIRAGKASAGETGGVFTFEDRHFRLTRTVSSLTVSDDPSSNAAISVDVSRDMTRVYNAVRCITHPVEIDGSAVSLYALPTGTTPAVLDNGELTITCKYQDTDQSYTLIGATEIVAPVRVTDYTINVSSNGGGADMTGDLRDVILATSTANLIGYWMLADQQGVALRDEVHQQQQNASASQPVTVAGTGGRRAQYACKIDWLGDQWMEDRINEANEYYR